MACRTMNKKDGNTAQTIQIGNPMFHNMLSILAMNYDYITFHYIIRLTKVNAIINYFLLQKYGGADSVMLPPCQ